MRLVRNVCCLLSLIPFAGCGGGILALVQDPGEPAFSVLLFGARPYEVTNAYLPLVPGQARIHTVATEDGVETIVVETLSATTVVAGIECAVVRDRVFLDGLLIEDTLDWFAQDLDGNVWYMGEAVLNYEYDDDENVIAIDTEGSWEAGKDVAGVGSLAEPGIVMKATFVVGDTYRQEFYAGEAEDMGEIVALDVRVTLADGSSFLCLKTRDTTPLEPGQFEFKYYAPGMGVVVEEKPGEPDRLEYRGSFDLTEASLPDVDDVTFTNPAQISHPMIRFLPGSVWEYEKETDEGLEEILVEVLPLTRMVMGIDCAVVRVREYLDGVIQEDTHDWYAQDDEGNVWYMGEEVVNYEYDELGTFLGTNGEGAWEAGIDGAEPGILLHTTPVVGLAYREEFYEGEAEDMGVVVSLTATVVLDDGTTFLGCIQVLEWTPLEPDALEYKYYAPGLGLVLEESLDDGERVELSGP
ncbi:MAG: hypothetical protein ACT4PV_07190 [Planctomycetaceae bacterium]